jgi:hypothetical protein
MDSGETYNFGTNAEKINSGCTRIAAPIIKPDKLPPHGYWQYVVGGAPDENMVKELNEPCTFKDLHRIYAKYYTGVDARKAATISAHSNGINVVYKIMHKISLSDRKGDQPVLNTDGWKWLENREGIVKGVKKYMDGSMDLKTRGVHSANKIWLALVHLCRSLGTPALQPDIRVYSRMAKTNIQKVQAVQDKQETTTKQKENLPLPHEILQNGIILHNRAKDMDDIITKLNKIKGTPEYVSARSKVMAVLLGNLAYQIINMQEGSVVFRNQGIYDVAISYPGEKKMHPNSIKINPRSRNQDLVITYTEYKTDKAVAKERSRLSGQQETAEFSVTIVNGSKAHEAFWLTYNAWPQRRWLLPKLTKDEKRDSLSELVDKNMWILDDGKKPLGGNYRTTKQTVQMMDPKLVKADLRLLQEQAFQTKNSDIRHVYNKKDVMADFKASVDLMKFVDPQTGAFFPKNKKRVQTLLGKINMVETNKVLIPEVKPVADIHIDLPPPKKQRRS